VPLGRLLLRLALIGHGKRAQRVNHPLDGVWAKLARADEHLKALDAEIPVFLDSNPHTYRGHIDREASRYVVTIHITRPPPIEWSVIVGDFVHNLRSALDHLVWQLVLLSGNEPVSGPGGNQFPIFTTKPGDMRLRNNRFNRQLRGVHRSVRAAIHRIQPYRAGRDANRRPLAVLADLSNEDKHQAILPSYAAIPPREGQIDLYPVKLVDVEFFERMEVHVNKPLIDGAEVMSADIVITGPDPQVKMEGELPFDVAFGEGMAPMASLGIVRNAVNEVVGTLGRLFKRG
jgi:hypothetical protein